MRVFDHTEVYRTQLSKFAYYGHALWRPDPESSGGEIQIGDVGYFSEGTFKRLFNVIHSDPPIAGCPRMSSQDLELAGEDEYPCLTNRVLRSESVQNVGGGAGISGASMMPHLPALTVEGAFQNNSFEGAVLYVSPSARRRVITPNTIFKDYIRTYHPLWCAYVKQVLHRSIDPSNIVLVSGWVKTSAWAMAAFQSQAQAASGRLKGGLSIAQLGFEWKFQDHTNVLYQTNQGPTSLPIHDPNIPLQSLTDETLSAFTQSIFVCYYKIKYRLFHLLPKVMVAGAGPAPLPDGAPEGGGPSGITTETTAGGPEEAEYPMIPNLHTPIDCVLDYILESSDAKVAIASSGDLELLFPGEDSLTGDLKQYLKRSRPEILVDECDGTGWLDHKRLDASESSDDLVQLQSGSLPVTEPGTEQEYHPTAPDEARDAHQALFPVGKHLPMDIFLLIIDILIPSHDLAQDLDDVQRVEHGKLEHWEYRPRPTSSLKWLSRLSLVCKACHSLCAPLLHSRITLDVAQIPNVVEFHSTTPDNNISKFARILVVSGRAPWQACRAFLPEMFPNVCLLRCCLAEGGYIVDRPLGPHEAGRATSHALPGLKLLSLEGCTFTRPYELTLYLSGFSPSLERVSLSSPNALIHFELTGGGGGGTDLLKTDPAFGETGISNIRIVSEAAEGSAIWIKHLVPTWRWKTCASSESSPAFVGICTSQLKRVVDFLGLMRNEGQQWLRIAQANRPNLWTAWLDNEHYDIEFHCDNEWRQDEETREEDRGARISHVVLRFHRDCIHQIDALRMAGLPHLLTCTLETPSISDSEHIAEAVVSHPWVHAKIRRVSCEEAQDIAIEARGGRLPTDFEYPISPLWYSDRYEERRARWLQY